MDRSTTTTLNGTGCCAVNPSTTDCKRAPSAAGSTGAAAVVVVRCPVRSMPLSMLRLMAADRRIQDQDRRRSPPGPRRSKPRRRPTRRCGGEIGGWARCGSTILAAVAMVMVRRGRRQVRIDGGSTDSLTGGHAASFRRPPSTAVTSCWTSAPDPGRSPRPWSVPARASSPSSSTAVAPATSVLGSRGSRSRSCRPTHRTCAYRGGRSGSSPTPRSAISTALLRRVLAPGSHLDDGGHRAALPRRPPLDVATRSGRSTLGPHVRRSPSLRGLPPHAFCPAAPMDVVVLRVRRR